MDSHPGCVCMGGYGEDGLASCEFFFPLRDCPDHKGIYPVFGKVIEGMDEIWRLEKVKTRHLDLRQRFLPRDIEYIYILMHQIAAHL